MKFDFVVVGGGMAGLCAAVSAARNGIKTAIIQDRPMFGGNASSEVRMWICGAHDVKETGLLEEVQLNNYYYNPTLRYTIWDDVMYSLAKEEKNLTVFLNTTVRKTVVENGKIVAVKAWHLVQYEDYVIEGTLFADCSGDSILRSSGARYRRGRESQSEFDECHAPAESDAKTMGNSILIQLRATDKHVPFRAPAWAYHYDEKTCPKRDMRPTGHNFWWMEFGGLLDTVKDSDLIREELFKIAYGTWEYIKNHPDKRGHHWELDWIGSLPGKRENIRYEGDHVLCQKEVEAGGEFADKVCFGGWSMDDHHPEAIYYPGAPTIFHPAPSPYGIPYRSLYSVNIDNLFFAGRNISATHMAMSSTRVMATCATMGQAIGTAAALAVKYGTTPRGVYEQHLDELQQTLMDQDQFIPGLKREVSQLSLSGELDHPILRDGFDRDWEKVSPAKRKGAKQSSPDNHDFPVIENGFERNWEKINHGKEFARNETATYQFKKAVTVKGCRLVFDSDLDDVKRQMCVEGTPELRAMPAKLVRDFAIEVLDKKQNWVEIYRNLENCHRYVPVAFAPVKTTGVRLKIYSSWGGKKAKVFSFELK